MKTKKSAAKAVSTPNIKSTAEPQPVKAAPAPVAMAKSVPAPTPSASTTTNDLTVIDVKLDVGFGNAVFLRGQGGGLNWEHGVALKCVDGKTWRWSGKTKDPVTFKPLINDEIWSAGNDLTVKPGQKVEISPNFS